LHAEVFDVASADEYGSSMARVRSSGREVAREKESVSDRFIADLKKIDQIGKW